MADKFQWFQGVKFTRDDTTGYYQNSTIHKSMHQFVWEYYNGPRPIGYDIHHKDFDKGNNAIINLQLLESHEHKKLHGQLLTDEQRQWKRDNLNTKARPKAIEWHKSEAGSEWHREHMRKQHEKGVFNKKVERVCLQCGKIFMQADKGGKAFCSGACAQKYRRVNKLGYVERICLICNNPFLTDKYRKAITCSKKCSAQYRKIKHESKTGTKNTTSLFGV